MIHHFVITAISTIKVPLKPTTYSICLCGEVDIDSRKEGIWDLGLSEMAVAKVEMDVGNDGVAVITMSNPPVNALAIPSELQNLSNLRFRQLLFSLPF